MDQADGGVVGAIFYLNYSLNDTLEIKFKKDLEILLDI
jgi:hypothetical protein